MCTEKQVPQIFSIFYLLALDAAKIGEWVSLLTHAFGACWLPFKFMPIELASWDRFLLTN